MKPKRNLKSFRVQIEKYLILFVLSFLFFAVKSQNISTVNATASATIVKEVPSIELTGEVNFTRIDHVSQDPAQNNAGLKIGGSLNYYILFLNTDFEPSARTVDNVSTTEFSLRYAYEPPTGAVYIIANFE